MKNQKNPLVSVLMPNYNCEKYISEAIESILKQTYKNFEFIIIDDFSTDNSWKIIKKYSKKDKRIKCFRNEKNLQIVKTLNFGLTKCIGKYIARMDSDDISLKNRLKVQVEFLERNKKFVGCGTNLEMFWNKKKNTIKRLYEFKYKSLYKNRLIKSPFAHPAIMIKSEIYKKYKYDENFLYCEDWELWLKILKKYEMINLNKNLYLYRQFDTQTKFLKTKRTIYNCIRLRFKYMSLRDYFNLKLIIRILIEFILLFLPKKFILWLFYKSLK